MGWSALGQGRCRMATGRMKVRCVYGMQHLWARKMGAVRMKRRWAWGASPESVGRWGGNLTRRRV